MGAAERWKEPQANLQTAKQIGDFSALSGAGTALYSAGKLPRVNFLILRELGELADAIVQPR
jgi:hypothetical protein